MSLLRLVSITLLIEQYNGQKTQSQTWNINISESDSSSFYYFFNKAVGSGHGSLLLRSDWQQYMTQGHDLINFSMVRAHGILDDDVGVVNGEKDFSFINVDKIYEFLLSINMKPYIEISFMPDKFASQDTTIEHYKGNTSPPISWNDWYIFINEWVNHLVSYFGIDQVSQWHFEIWNEPYEYIYILYIIFITIIFCFDPVHGVVLRCICSDHRNHQI